MGLTLIEAAKLANDPISSAIVEMYAGSSEILQILPFENILGNALKYNRETALPGVGFRGVNEAYTASQGVLNPISEALVIAGGDLDVDKFIIQTMGQNVRSTHEKSKARALSLAWTDAFINGSQVDDPREFDGLKTRIVGSQLIPAGSTNGGTALSLAVMDEAIDQTLNPTHIVMNKGMARKFSTAARTTTVGGNVNFTKDEFGKRIMTYNDLPIVTVDLNNAGNSIIGNVETTYTSSAWSGTATGTSIYIISVGSDMLTGIQNGNMMVTDLGELQTQPMFRTRVEWYAAIAIFNGRAVTRLGSIADSAIAA